MEIFELKYFLGVAAVENIHRASQKLAVSPGSLSKAVSRLESELGVKLFSRSGRSIVLTAAGIALQDRAARIVRLEEDTKLQIGGQKGTLQITIAGPEILLSKMGIEIAAQLAKKHPGSTFQFNAFDEHSTLEQVRRGEAHLGLTTVDLPKSEEITAKAIGEVKFLTFIGKGHPLFALAKAKKSVPVEVLLKHAFVKPTHALLGQVGLKQSLDGWRDDQFERKVGFLTSSLKTLEALVSTGQAVAYLPDYFGQNLNFEVITVTGCPYRCVQKISMIARYPKDLGWLNQLFSPRSS